MSLEVDLIIIHGYNRHEDGTMDQIEKDRLDFGIDLFDDDVAQRIVVASGQRDAKFFEETGIPQSVGMREYLESRGIPSDVIWEEVQGTNTFDCTQFVYDNYIVPNCIRSLVIVSSAEHLPRIALQTLKIFPPDIDVFYAGPPVPDSEREAFVDHERKAIIYAASRED